jgi:hypothetical protein
MLFEYMDFSTKYSEVLNEFLINNQLEYEERCNVPSLSNDDFIEFYDIVKALQKQHGLTMEVYSEKSGKSGRWVSEERRLLTQHTNILSWLKLCVQEESRRAVVDNIVEAEGDITKLSGIGIMSLYDETYGNLLTAKVKESSARIIKENWELCGKEAPANCVENVLTTAEELEVAQQKYREVSEEIIRRLNIIGHQ